MTRKEWDAVYDRHFRDLFDRYSAKDPKWRQVKARERTRIETGTTRPGSGLFGGLKEKLGMKLLSSFLPGIVKGVGDGQYGEGVQKVYWWFAGKKTWISIGLFAAYTFVTYVLVPVLLMSGVAQPETVPALQAWVSWIPPAVPFLIGIGVFDAAVRIEPPQDGVFVTPPGPSK